MRQVRWTVMIAAAVMLTAVADGRETVLHRVGGKFGWTYNAVNYTEWSLNETPRFYVGDWLQFAYDKHRYNVLEVNQTGYEQCRDQGFIKNITRGGGKDVFNLTEAKTYYFLSGGGYCYQGMKLFVDVVDYSRLAPAPTPGNSPPRNIDTVITYLVISLLFAVITHLPWALV
ncbi:Phytocyanin domain-containing protein [Heracleum sosnowskyi]|uniref:Phytocyanin domain-containing protein n=1 Tax=Heracleum sosnowskyi TaxID=360622 RepID=A0AAD8H300_9APIA|nr:Phytocyanin domain-containing protein [Heracleum sosnowskyi]